MHNKPGKYNMATAPSKRSGDWKAQVTQETRLTDQQYDQGRLPDHAQ